MSADIYNRLATDQTYIPMCETTDEIEQILAQIRMVLGTRQGDVLGSPNYGVDISQYIFSLSYDQEQINQVVKEAIMLNIHYDQAKYTVDVKVDFGKDRTNASDYAVIQISINQRKCLGIVINQ